MTAGSDRSVDVEAADAGAGHRRPASVQRPRALVTGASSGLGLAYARNLAADSYDLVLVARDDRRLQETARRMESEFGIHAEAITADLSTAAGITGVESLIESTRIDVLINNAGYGIRGGLLDSPIVEVEAQDMVLGTAVRRLSLAAARAMRRRGRGGIVNVASLAAVTTMGQYAAAKAATVVFTEALAGELADQPITVTAVLPGFVRTDFHRRLGVDRPGPDWIWLSAEHVVAESLSDARHGRVVSVPGWRYKIAAAVARLVPRAAIRWASRGFSFSRSR